MHAWLGLISIMFVFFGQLTYYILAIIIIIMLVFIVYSYIAIIAIAIYMIVFSTLSDTLLLSFEQHSDKLFSLYAAINQARSLKYILLNCSILFHFINIAFVLAVKQPQNLHLHAHLYDYCIYLTTASNGIYSHFAL